MVVSIYTSRIILKVLGVENYGIYNLVGGFVSTFSLLSSTLSVAGQRYLTYEIGKRKNEAKTIFTAIISIHTILTIIIFILLETIGSWFLNYHLNIDPDKITAANIVFQCSTISFCINILNIPFNSVIMAHERMNVFAYISIYEVFAKLGILYLLQIFNYDRLISYAILLFLLHISLRIIYRLYCKSKYPQYTFEFKFNKDLSKKILSFSSWNLIGTSATLANSQGINIITNIYFGVTLNAVRGLAEQVSNAIQSFMSNFITALNPPIIKNYSSGNFDLMNSQICQGGKYGTFLYWLIALPLLTETDLILKFWLETVPLNLSLFIKLSIIFSLVQSFSQTLYIGMIATGNIKKYQIIVGLLSFSAFPATYIMFYLGYGAEWGYFTIIISSLVCLIARLCLLKGMIPNFSIPNYLIQCILKSIFVILITYSLSYYIVINFREDSIWWLILYTTFSILINIITFFIIGLNNKERTFILNLLRTYILNYKR